MVEQMVSNTMIAMANEIEQFLILGLELCDNAVQISPNFQPSVLILAKFERVVHYLPECMFLQSLFVIQHVQCTWRAHLKEPMNVRLWSIVLSKLPLDRQVLLPHLHRHHRQRPKRFFSLLRYGPKNSYHKMSHLIRYMSHTV